MSYEVCKSCRVKRNLDEMPECIICLDVVIKSVADKVRLDRIENKSPRHKQAVLMRRTGMTFEKIGEKLSVSRQRVQQMLTS